MQWAKGDLIDVMQEHDCNVLGFTANSVVMKKTPFTWELVMGKGAALRVKQFQPNIHYKLGEKIAMRSTHSQNTEELKERFVHGVQPDYYVAGYQNLNGIMIAAVQVKRDYRDDGDWELTKKSLKAFVKALELRGGKAVMNCPLIGAGGWGDRRAEVESMVESVLGDSQIIVCTFD